MRKKSSSQKLLLQIICISSMLWAIVGCSVPAVTPSSALPSATPLLLSPTATSYLPTDGEDINGLSDEEIATLSSLEKVDDHPLYTMHYFGGYDQRLSVDTLQGSVIADLPEPNRTSWACSLFAALGDAENMLFGRNFDWEYSPAVLLFTNPPGGYASVSMVDIAYLGYEETEAGTLIDLPIDERRALLDAPFLPFDGMNEHGLTVGMAAVPPGHMRSNPEKETIDSLMVIRKMLDRARDVDEAVAIMGSYNIDMGGGPPLHYLIADRSGRSVLVEFYQGELVVISNEVAWHQATNFLRSSSVESAEGICWRYDAIHRWMENNAGQVTLMEAIDLLKEVSQEGTQWSIVYGINAGDIHVVMGQRYQNIHSYQLNSSEN